MRSLRSLLDRPPQGKPRGALLGGMGGAHGHAYVQAFAHGQPPDTLAAKYEAIKRGAVVPMG